MIYTINKMDGRFSYRRWFEYYVGFSGRMHGPVQFNQAVKWVTETYGWSAEVKQYATIHKWSALHRQLGTLSRQFSQTAHSDLHLGIDIAEICNPEWSWSNGYNDLRIYLASEQQLAFFCLKFPIDQK